MNESILRIYKRNELGELGFDLMSCPFCDKNNLSIKIKTSLEKLSPKDNTDFEAETHTLYPLANGYVNCNICGVRGPFETLFFKEIKEGSFQKLLGQIIQKWNTRKEIN